MLLALAWSAILVTRTLGHAAVTAPAPRTSGVSQQLACGTAVTKKLNNDKYGPIENAVAAIDNAYDQQACHLFFCRGYQLEDNIDRVQSYSVGDIIPFKVEFEAHHTGTANVSVVSLSTQTTIGDPLIYWPIYAEVGGGPSPKNESEFNVTIPDVAAQCDNAGQCAIQWWWYAYSNDQTYESCVDFVLL